MDPHPRSDAQDALRDLLLLQETPLPTQRQRSELLAKAVALLTDLHATRSPWPEGLRIE